MCSCGCLKAIVLEWSNGVLKEKCTGCGKIKEDKTETKTYPDYFVYEY
jgi:hypothetical protein